MSERIIAPMSQEGWETFLGAFELNTTPGQEFCPDVPGRDFDSTLKSYLLALKTGIGDPSHWRLVLDKQYKEQAEGYPLHYAGEYVQALAWNSEPAESVLSELEQAADRDRLIPILDTATESNFTEEFEAEKNIIKSLERVGVIYKIEGDEVNYQKIVEMTKRLGDRMGRQDYGYYWPGEQLQLGVLALEASRGNDEAVIEQWNKVTQESTYSNHFRQSLGEMIVNQVSRSTLEQNGIDLLNICKESESFCREYLKAAERYEEAGNSVKAREAMEEALNLVQDRMYGERGGYGMDSWLGSIYCHPLAEKYLEIGYEEIQVLEEEVIARVAEDRSFGFMDLMKAYANRGWVAEIDRVYRILEGKTQGRDLQMLVGSYCTSMMKAGESDLVKEMLATPMPNDWRLYLTLCLGYEASEHKGTIEHSVSLLGDVSGLENSMADNLTSTPTEQLSIGDHIILERMSTNELTRRILRQCLKFRRVDVISDVLKVNGVSDESKVEIMWETYLHSRRNIGSVNFVL